MLLVEDIHWIDQSSEQLLRRLLDSVAGARVLALITHRPGYTWPQGDRSYFSRISLHGLPGALVDELTESVLGRSDLPKALKRLIVERSDGNPFFAEELAKSLRELGVFEQDGANAGLAIEVPSTVQEVIMARIDRLDEDAKHALQVASVIGREFSVRVLERMKDWSASPSETLDKLRSLELIYEKALHPELAYMFKHALTHDVAYGTLLHSQRRDLHRQIGALIEEIYADRLPEFYETLAYQYRQAELVERAARYALLSGERAASHQAPEAEQHFREAATLARGRADAADIFIGAQAGLGDLLLVQGKIDAANEAYADAIRVAPDDQTTRWLNNKLTYRYFCERDGVRLAYYVQGKADEAATAAPTIPIVLLHPLIQGSYSFNLLALRLCQEYRVIYMDPRGSGASDRPSGPFDFGARVQDAVAILRQLPYPRFVLVGDSDGLRMAVHVFHAMPERVDRMVSLRRHGATAAGRGVSGRPLRRADRVRTADVCHTGLSDGPGELRGRGVQRAGTVGVARSLGRRVVHDDPARPFRAVSTRRDGCRRPGPAAWGQRAHARDRCGRRHPHATDPVRPVRCRPHSRCPLRPDQGVEPQRAVERHRHLPRDDDHVHQDRHAAPHRVGAVTCNACGLENPPGFKLCGQCAAPLPVLGVGSQVSGADTQYPAPDTPKDPLSYTPKHLADKFLHARSAMDRRSASGFYGKGCELAGHEGRAPGWFPVDQRQIGETA